eukprot:CAMPEP_0116070684 /NCGR_PEP_ID=MMETSP0322-20121206/13215_1 /TAXON_ID=163516 /ORGANISM="Leptocylindrus danicus var. apora, Strain B651" /LENGTH=596 /DNA_ID=CAMNT_0003558657 /DNA_START=160 /DNA_END=1950 /DNA_ORIENTATION=-
MSASSSSSPVPSILSPNSRRRGRDLQVVTPKLIMKGGNRDSSLDSDDRDLSKIRRSFSSNRRSIFVCLLTACFVWAMSTLDLKENIPHFEEEDLDPEFDEETFEEYGIRANDVEEEHRIAGLSCEKYGYELPTDVLHELIYWRDIPDDSNYKSPFYDEEKFLAFEPDEGGWNNIRMGFETAVLMAHAMGRTLVLPPEKRMYLLSKRAEGHKLNFDFNDFYHMDSLANEHAGINIITMDEFLQHEALTGKLYDSKNETIQYPPRNETDWNGKPLKDLWEYLDQVGTYPEWEPVNCLAAFPASSDKKDIDQLTASFDEVKTRGKLTDIPVNVDAPIADRLQENLAQRSKLCIYDEELQSKRLIFFKNGYPQHDSRLLVHFYTFLFFQDWKQDLFSKRFVRDHMRYVDELMCAAGAVVNAMHEKAKASGNGMEFNTLHVRRGDFQYKKTRIEANEIYSNISDLLPDKSTLYIATDEKNKAFFEILKEHYDVYFLDDFFDLVPNLNKHYYGMLEQIILSTGKTFIGTYYSTFSGYVMRLRGYRSSLMKLPGHELGIHNSFYYVPRASKMLMREYSPVRKPFWAREFPVGWRDIDNDVNTI